MVDQTNILIVDDDEDLLGVCRVLLKKRFDMVVTCQDPISIPALMAERDFHAVMLDPRPEAPDLRQRVLGHRAGLPVLVSESTPDGAL